MFSASQRGSVRVRRVFVSLSEGRISVCYLRLRRSVETATLTTQEKSVRLATLDLVVQSPATNMPVLIKHHFSKMTFKTNSMICKSQSKQMDISR